MVGRPGLDPVDDLSRLPEIPRRLERRVGEGLVVLVEARLEDAHDGESFEARARAERRGRTAEGRDQEQGVADREPHRHREMPSHDDPWRARGFTEGGESRFEAVAILTLEAQGFAPVVPERTEVVLEIGHVPDGRWIDPTQAHARDLPLAPAHHALGVDVRTRRFDAGRRDDLREDLFVVEEGAEARVHGEVGAVAEDLVPPGLLEAIHDREHDDDQPDPRRDSAHADRGDRRNEDLPALGHEVADRDEPLDALSHRNEAADRERDQPEHDRAGKETEHNR